MEFKILQRSRHGDRKALGGSYVDFVSSAIQWKNLPKRRVTRILSLEELTADLLSKTAEVPAFLLFGLEFGLLGEH